MTLRCGDGSCRGAVVVVRSGGQDRGPPTAPGMSCPSRPPPCSQHSRLTS